MTARASNDVEVAVVGGGLAGAAVAARLAAAGHDVAVFERLAEPRWRACGVYSSPLTRRRLASLGLGATSIQRLVKPIPAMVLETAAGDSACRLDHPSPYEACGLDRLGLDAAMLALIRQLGADVFAGAVVRSISFENGRPQLSVSQSDGSAAWTARLVVGADGPTSIVARSAKVVRGRSLYRRAALSGHRADASLDARMILGKGWYLGLAPVPGGRTNLGLVMAESELRRQLHSRRPADVVSDAVSRTIGGQSLCNALPTDEVAAHLPLVHRVARTAGEGFLLVGDAAGFVDPLSGDGVHRALVSAEMAAAAIGRHLAGDREALRDYDRRLRARFRSKDALSWLLQLFVLQPGLARRAIDRLDRHEHLRRQFAAALADLVPATTVLSPRFIARVLA